jgi:hypothetical protein
MAGSAPRVDKRLIAALGRLDREDRPIAETHRLLGLVADELGLPRPSYERVRLRVLELRRRGPEPGIGSVLLDIALQQRPPESIIDALIDRRK